METKMKKDKAKQNKATMRPKTISIDKNVIDLVNEVAVAEERSFSSALSRMARIGHDIWKRSANLNTL